MPSSRANSGGKRRDAGEAGVANVAVEAVMPWQHSAKQIAMNGQFFPVSELSWWQGISSAAAATIIGAYEEGELNGNSGAPRREIYCRESGLGALGRRM